MLVFLPLLPAVLPDRSPSPDDNSCNGSEAAGGDVALLGWIAGAFAMKAALACHVTTGW